MDLNTIRNELHALAQLADAWTRPDAIPAIERDLMLEKLRNLYEAVRFSLPAPGAEPAVAESVEEVLPIDLGAVLSLGGLPDARTADEAAAVAVAPEIRSDLEPEGARTAFAAPVIEPAGRFEVASEPALAADVAGESAEQQPAPEEVAAEAPTEPAGESDAASEALPAVEPIVLPEVPAENSAELGAASTSDPQTAPQPEIPTEPEAEPLVPQPESQPAVEPVVLTKPAASSEPIRASEPVVLSEIPAQPEPAVRSVAAAVERLMAAEETPAESDPKSEVAPEVSTASKPEVQMEIVAEFESEDCETEADFAPVPDARPVAEAPVILERPERPAPWAGSIPEAEEPRRASASQLDADRDEEMRSRHKQRVILSLYDHPMAEDRSPARESVSEAEVRPAEFRHEPAAERASAVAEEAPASTPTEVPAEPEADGASAGAPERPEVPAGAVLGDVINHDVQTLADTIEAPRSIASELHRNERVVDLRKAVGINDRFLLIRDLFDGDTEAYERAIGQLDAFEDFDACMIHIAENYAWNSDSDGARLLMDLLERKFA